MRALCVVATLLAATAAQPACASTVTGDDAMQRVRSAGYPFVSRSDATPEGWDVWASKDGIVYKVKVDASSGTLIAATPVEVDD